MQSFPRSFPSLPPNKGRRFYLQLMITMICIGIIPPLVMNLAAYNKMSTTFYRESSENNIKYLNQTINSVEIIVNQILSSSQQLMLNGAVREFESFPNGAYYENLQGAFNYGDLSEHYHYLKGKQNAFDNIRRFKLSNTFVDSVYLYDSGSRVVHAIDSANREVSMPFDEFYDRDWFSSLQQNSVSPLFSDTRSASLGGEERKDVLTILLRTGVKDNCVVINLEASKVYEQILDKINPSDELYVTNHAGQILLYRDGAMLNHDIRGSIVDFQPDADRDGYFLEKVNEREAMVSYSKSSVLNWWFVHVVGMEKLLQMQSYLKQTILLYFGVLVAFVVILSILSSKRLYRPISFTLQERNYYKEKMEESLPFYRERFKLSLLRQHALNEQELREKIGYLQADVPTEAPIVWLVSRDNDDRSGSYASHMDKILLMEAIRECPEMKRKQWTAVEADGDYTAIILSAAHEELSSIFLSAQHLLDYAQTKLSFELSVGVSRPCESLAELPRAYAEAEEALRYRIVWGGGQVIYYGDVASHMKTQYAYPSKKTDLLCGSIKLGNADKAVGIFKEWVDDIQQQRNSVHYDQMMPVYMRLLNEIMAAVGETGYNMGRIKKEDPYRALIMLKSAAQVFKWLEGFIRDAALLIQEEQQLTGNQHIEKAKQIIQRDFSKDVTLQSVSDELSLSPNYISRLFKQSTGHSFVDYVTSLRMERAKTLLVEQNLKVNEICAMVGYHNSYYFIKVFKEYTGMTPGEYRKLALNG